jgi:2-polyprenyl-3-methyl-5-hydroxy-6-metoxy-1,4-benzoquinol methylase
MVAAQASAECPVGARLASRSRTPIIRSVTAPKRRLEVASRHAREDIEQAVIGGDWGAEGYTTVAQADRLGDLLHLRPGMRLLDLGAGRGWPGLYLAATTGCRVVLTDIPLAGLRVATARADTEHAGDRTTAVVSNARALPFRPASFDAVVHTDVLC